MKLSKSTCGLVDRICQFWLPLIFTISVLSFTWIAGHMQESQKRQAGSRVTAASFPVDPYLVDTEFVTEGLSPIVITQPVLPAP